MSKPSKYPINDISFYDLFKRRPPDNAGIHGFRKILSLSTLTLNTRNVKDDTMTSVTTDSGPNVVMSYSRVIRVYNDFKNDFAKEILPSCREVRQVK